MSLLSDLVFHVKNSELPPNYNGTKNGDSVYVKLRSFPYEQKDQLYKAKVLNIFNDQSAFISFEFNNRTVQELVSIEELIY